MPAEEDLYAREHEHTEQIARLSHYDRELRAIQERLDQLTAREQSGMPLSPSDNEERGALLISREATLAALQKDFPGVEGTPSGLEQALTQYESEAYAVAVEMNEQVSQGLLRLPKGAYDALFPEQAPNQQQSGHHAPPPEEHHSPLRERFRQAAEEARKVQEPSQEYDHDH